MLVANIVTHTAVYRHQWIWISASAHRRYNSNYDWPISFPIPRKRGLCHGLILTSVFLVNITSFVYIQLCFGLTNQSVALDKQKRLCLAWKLDPNSPQPLLLHVIFPWARSGSATFASVWHFLITMAPSGC